MGRIPSGTLTAVHDWSYELLAEPERATLRRLAIFVGPISLESAVAVARGTDQTASEAIEHSANLVAKSLISADVTGSIPKYRLFETTRAYALTKLEESGERAAVARWHSEYFRERFERADAEWETSPAVEWLTEYRPCLDNVRVALDWAFAPGGDDAVGIALAVAALPLWFQLSLMDECRRRILQALNGSADGDRDPRHAVALYAALGATLMFTPSGTGPEIRSAWERTFELAELIDDHDFRMRALWGPGRSLRTHRELSGLSHWHHRHGADGARLYASAEVRGRNRHT